MTDSGEGKGDVRAGQALAALLDDLKHRSGHSYGADQRELSKLYRLWEQASFPKPKSSRKPLQHNHFRLPGGAVHCSVSVSCSRCCCWRRGEHTARRPRCGFRRERSDLDEQALPGTR
ncbi:hypothetical protein NLX83_18830 [Allokutzneria sp. A3M-2-11 16]|uniref:hypothetical protein n=1 Tax=Allokutzneria sp. A3M-2-11 16 TaxID=2962043 RepID=UPI0020B860AD|nr:hypothetical protein [Allokutzneria sp. A3M-2-11 16]MCP3801320.1 hypothetical protein [Allokutzneria sp. A3M-2-11 16]